jgi:tetratricopeptide (TPR) repeat protein
MVARGEPAMKRAHITRWLGIAACVLLAALPAKADYIKAVQYYKEGQYAKAIQELQPDLVKNPNWEDGHRLMGLCYLNLQNYALAIVELSRAVQLKTPVFITYQYLAQAYFNSDRIDQCVQTLTQGEPLAKQPSEQYSLHHLRGSAYYRLQKFDEAINDLTEAIRIKATEWTDFSQLGISYYHLNRYDEAGQALQKALSLKPGDPISTQLLGKSYFMQGVAALTSKQYSQALDLLRKAGTHAPNDGYVIYNTGEAYLFLTNYAEAEKAYLQALNLLPRNSDVYSRLGLVYEKQKKWNLSLNAYQKANELTPSPSLKEAIARVIEMKKQSKSPS